jgi:hypothetical protein
MELQHSTFVIANGNPAVRTIRAYAFYNLDNPEP